MTSVGGTCDVVTEIGYPMRRWVFEDSAGRYEIDLGDSHVQCNTLRQLKVPYDIELGYGIDQGSEQLRALIADRYGGSLDSVAVTHGAQEALYLVYNVLLHPGDQVITFRPGWQQSWDAPVRLGCRVDVLDFDPEFAIDVDDVISVAGPDLRLIVVNTPCNPTGRHVRERELSALAGLAARTGAYLLLDEEYSLDLKSSAAAGGDRRIISVSSLSKVYGLPGLRVGWLYGPAEVVSACTERKHLTTIANSALCEALACDVLCRHQFFIDEYRRLTSVGLGQLQEWVARNNDAVQLVQPEGTPFAWLGLTTGEPSLKFCRRVLDTGVLLMPGETLGAHDSFRLCFAREPEILAEGLRRIDTVLAATRGNLRA